MQRNLVLLICIIIFNSTAFKIKPSVTKFPKISYTKIHDISYRRPLYIRKKRPYILNLFNQINNTISYIFHQHINNYIDEVYAMASLPLSFNFINNYNKTNK